MPLFVISWLDKSGGLETRMGAREAHLAYVRDHPGVVKLGGPYLDPEGRMIGSLMIIEAEDLDAAYAFHDADPYKLAGLFQASDVRPWRATIGAFA